jgi:penicillin-binding protein-related factor A (putative recombinase)
MLFVSVLRAHQCVVLYCVLDHTLLLFLLLKHEKNSNLYEMLSYDIKQFHTIIIKHIGLGKMVIVE